MNVADKYGWTALHVALNNRHMTVAKQLLNEDLNLGIMSILGFTALNMAVHRYHSGVVRLLVKSGANPRLLDSYGRSSLVWAVRDTETSNGMGQVCDGYAPTDPSSTASVSQVINHEDIESIERQ